MGTLDAVKRSTEPDAEPKCTVAIPLYNRKDMIEATLKSVLSQQLTDLEVLVVDDCSTDGSWDVLKTFHDSRLRLVRNEANVGLFGNFNRCLQLARGTYVRILGSDDQLAEHCLARECAFMDANPNVAIVNCSATLINADGRTIGVSGNHFEEGIYPSRTAIAGILWHKAQYGSNPLSCLSAVLLRHSVLRKVGWFDTSMRMCGDFDLLLRMMEHGDFAVLCAEGAVIRVHPGAVGYQLKYSPAPLAEIIAITRRYAGLLEEVGLFDEVQRRMPAMLVSHALVLRSKGKCELSKQYLREAAEYHAEWPRLAVGVARFFCLHFLRVAFGVHVLPPLVRRARILCRS